MSNDSADATSGDNAGNRVERLTQAARDRTFANLRPRDSATLILVDRSGAVPKVLLGRRHQNHKFLPGKFVFPGGRVEPFDRRMTAAAPLHERDTARLMRQRQTPRRSQSRGDRARRDPRDL